MTFVFPTSSHNILEHLLLLLLFMLADENDSHSAFDDITSMPLPLLDIANAFMLLIANQLMKQPTTIPLFSSYPSRS